MAIFTPNLTSKLLLKSGTKVLENTVGAVLELGCGSGWITEKLISDHGTTEHKYWLSDISDEAINFALKSLIPPLTTENFAVGKGMSPWKDRQFDVIVNDIAGISDGIAEISDWYEGVPFRAGMDGLENTREVLAGISQYLASDGVYIAPIISLSDVVSYKALLANVFNDVIFEGRTFWPMPDKIVENHQLLNQLRRDGHITLQEKYSKLLAFTEVCVCRNLKSD